MEEINTTEGIMKLRDYEKNLATSVADMLFDMYIENIMKTLEEMKE